MTPADIEENISQEVYFTGREGVIGAEYDGSSGLMIHKSLGFLTFCVLILKNGFAVAGGSRCFTPDNFCADMGRKCARADAIDKLYPLMLYELTQRLSNQASEG